MAGTGVRRGRRRALGRRRDGPAERAAPGRHANCTVAAGLRIGDPAAVVAEAERLTRDEPLREEGWRLHALALWSSGRQADALATLRRARGILAEELGLDPGPDLTALEEAILTQRTDVMRETVPPPPPTTPLPRPAPIIETSFVGREAQLSALVTAAAEAASDGVRIALVTGEAGLGKSTLLEHLGSRLERDGWLVAVGRCPEVDSAPAAGPGLRRWAVAASMPLAVRRRPRAAAHDERTEAR